MGKHPLNDMKGMKSMQAQYLGHVAFYVKELGRSLTFYRDVLGFHEVGKTFGGRAVALTTGRTHHEILLIEVGEASASPAGARRGLYPLASRSVTALTNSVQRRRNLSKEQSRSPA